MGEAIQCDLPPAETHHIPGCRIQSRLPDGWRSGVHLTTHNWSQFAGPHREWTDREIWERLRRVFVEQQGLRLEQITPEAGIVYDLGMD